MSKFHRKQNYKEPGFVPLHTRVQHEIRRPCSQCGKWIYIIELGFCRYKFVEYNYSIESNGPWTAVVRRCTDHICIDDKDSSPKISINYVQKRNNSTERHRMKPVLVEIL
ncbi:MAG TPA: hypothetical protein VE130_10795 [Nitrososphaeraceae archaeon]|jgi:hypothetical protein|nr:hypothetical protein [Nitrososphaeraceae archaeon]